MEDIQTRYCEMPCTIKAFTVSNSDGSYTIMINSRINAETALKSYMHELSHIQNDDYQKQCSVDLIEINSHEMR